MIDRMPIRYYGGKWRLADWIISFFPKHGHYVEPCGGGASVLLKKNPAKLETYNDLDVEIVNFFSVLRNKPDALVDSIKLTPWSRTELEMAAEDSVLHSSLERARRFWIKCWLSIGGAGEPTSFRISKKVSATPASILRNADYLYAVADRFIGVQLECIDALDCIDRYDGADTLIYFDPPYMTDTRSHKKQYLVECGDAWHTLASVKLKACKAFVVVSGYVNAAYKELYCDWERFDKDTLCNSGTKNVESVWLNPRLSEERRKGL